MNYCCLFFVTSPSQALPRHVTKGVIDLLRKANAKKMNVIFHILDASKIGMEVENYKVTSK